MEDRFRAAGGHSAHGSLGNDADKRAEEVRGELRQGQPASQHPPALTGTSADPASSRCGDCQCAACGQRHHLCNQGFVGTISQVICRVACYGPGAGQGQCRSAQTAAARCWMVTAHSWVASPPDSETSRAGGEITRNSTCKAIRSVGFLAKQGHAHEEHLHFRHPPARRRKWCATVLSDFRFGITRKRFSRGPAPGRKPGLCTCELWH